jgi:hypothetical protein
MPEECLGQDTMASGEEQRLLIRRAMQELPRLRSDLP